MNEDDYRDLGPDFRRAFELLNQHCEVPPSLEVFAEELRYEHRRRPCLSPVALASELVLTYKPIESA